MDPRTVIADLVPIGLAVALSPFPIVAIVMVLGGSGGTRAGAAFCAGWVMALGALTFLLLVLSGQVEPTGEERAWLRVALGLALLGYAWTKWVKRPRRGEAAAVPAWIASLDRAGPGRAALVGIVLGGVNPKSIGLATAAVAAISAQATTRQGAIAAAAVFTFIGSVTVLGAQFASALGGRRMEAPLSALRRFMLANNHLIMMVVFIVIGSKLLIEGLGALLS